jgi:hypothetical protein
MARRRPTYIDCSLSTDDLGRQRCQLLHLERGQVLRAHDGAGSERRAASTWWMHATESCVSKPHLNRQALACRFPFIHGRRLSCTRSPAAACTGVSRKREYVSSHAGTDVMQSTDVVQSPFCLSQLGTTACLFGTPAEQVRPHSDGQARRARGLVATGVLHDLHVRAQHTAAVSHLQHPH